MYEQKRNNAQVFLFREGPHKYDPFLPSKYGTLLFSRLLNRGLPGQAGGQTYRT